MSGASVDSSCLTTTLNGAFDKTRSNSLSTRGCGDRMQTISFEDARLVATMCQRSENCPMGQVSWKGPVLELLRNRYAAFLMGAEGWILQQDVHDALGGVAVPERWDAAGLAFSGENIMGGGNDFCGIGSNELVCALRDCDRALGVLAEGEAGDAEGGGFFLDTAGIGQDQRGFAEQAEEIEITDGRDQF